MSAPTPNGDDGIAQEAKLRLRQKGLWSSSTSLHPFNGICCSLIGAIETWPILMDCTLGNDNLRLVQNNNILGVKKNDVGIAILACPYDTHNFG